VGVGSIAGVVAIVNQYYLPCLHNHPSAT